MNILPLILALVLMLSVLTVEKLEKFKNQAIIQREYQLFMQDVERQVFNQRQLTLYKISQKSLRQLSFRFFVDKKLHNKDLNVSKQYRMLMIELMKIVYGEATFFKNLEKNRPGFLEEMLDAIEKAADAESGEMIKHIRDIARLNLEDPELQEAFYHMLKGTIAREKLKEIESLTPRLKEKAYVSLFTFINYDGKENLPRIVIQLAPREILKAVFVTDEIVDAVIVRRNELAASEDSGATAAFENEFKDKRRVGLDDKLLNFKISSSDKTPYN
jgi:hypothetical protein